MRVKLIFPDYLIIGALVLMLVNHSITTFLIGQLTTQEETKEEIDKIIKIVEGNPAAGVLLTYHKWRYLFYFVFAPSIYVGFYYYIRRKYWYNQEFINMMAIIIFIGLLINFSNDFGYLLGYLVR